VVDDLTKQQEDNQKYLLEGIVKGAIINVTITFYCFPNSLGTGNALDL
jgi:hypothetical protein